MGQDLQPDFAINIGDMDVLTQLVAQGDDE